MTFLSPTALNVHIFRDKSAVIGKLMHDFGNIYQSMNRTISNSTQLFWTLVNDESHNKLYSDVTFEEYESARAANRPGGRTAGTGADASSRRVAHCRRNPQRRRDAHARRRRGKWLRRPESVDPRELADELRSIMVEHRRLWLARNRPGGLNDSAVQLEKLLNDYEANQ